MRLRGWLRIRTALHTSELLQLNLAVEVRESPGLLEPGVVGFWRSVLLLPAGIADRLTPKQLHAVLTHELLHVRRRDNLTSAVHMIVEAVFWFHPLVWWIGARLVEERERACDEEVLRITGDSNAYAEGILNICKLYTESPLACVSGVTGSDIKKKIEAIMMNRGLLKLNLTKRVALAAAAVLAVALPVFVGLAKAPKAQAQTVAVPKYSNVSVSRCNDVMLFPIGKFNIARRDNPTPQGKRRFTCYPLTGGDFGINLISLAFTAGPGTLNLLPVVGDARWVDSDRFDIQWTIESSAENDWPVPVQLRALREILEDKFELKIRRETRQVPIYALKRIEGGLKLPVSAGGPQMPGRGGPEPDHNAKYTFINTNLQQFAFGFLSDAMDRPVKDMTGTSGSFDFDFRFTPTPRMVSESTHLRQSGVGGNIYDTPPSVPAPSIFEALKAYGLELVPTTGPQEFIVIDHIEKPAGL